MAKGRSIVLTVECKGQRLEGTAAEVISPGMGVAITLSAVNIFLLMPSIVYYLSICNNVRL